MSVVAVLKSITPADLERTLADPAVVGDLLSDGDRGRSPEDWCHLEKTQDAIHFLLTGDRWPTESVLSSAIYGIDATGFTSAAGPVMYLAPQGVGAVAAELTSIPREEIIKRYSPERLTEAAVYPNVWYDDPSALASVMADYDALVSFYLRAAALEKAVLIHIG